jgi:hypothetical protein
MGTDLANALSATQAASSIAAKHAGPAGSAHRTGSAPGRPAPPRSRRSNTSLRTACSQASARMSPRVVNVCTQLQ